MGNSRVDSADFFVLEFLVFISFEDDLQAVSYKCTEGIARFSGTGRKGRASHSCSDTHVRP
ncbi:hypothetical protein BDZ94DRAFT_1250220 [Collybia nuda]|uniref:Uncharacterized protein n=1 Tax=Collybia nuda TaxID=64659 RepID=A0A9P5YED8_9AGAR|nr:hypothetical protein BDZ94DRAFT_1250220 [Collybia nuda]